MAGDLKVVYAARTVPEAHLLKGLLEAKGIRAVVTNAVLEGGAGVDILGWPTLARVAVNEENAASARQIALEFDRTIARRSEADSVESEEDATAEQSGEEKPAEPTGPEPHASWPRCPQCQALRLTKCPVCGTSGTGFPPADATEPATGEGEESRLVLCIQCDEPFVPQYARRCEWCGHDFGEGLETPESPSPEAVPIGLLALAAAMIALVAGLILYFAILIGGS